MHTIQSTGRKAILVKRSKTDLNSADLQRSSTDSASLGLLTGIVKLNPIRAFLKIVKVKVWKFHKVNISKFLLKIVEI